LYPGFTGPGEIAFFRAPFPRESTPFLSHLFRSHQPLHPVHSFPFRTNLEEAPPPPLFLFPPPPGRRVFFFSSRQDVPTAAYASRALPLHPFDVAMLLPNSCPNSHPRMIKPRSPCAGRRQATVLLNGFPLPALVLPYQ